MQLGHSDKILRDDEAAFCILFTVGMKMAMRHSHLTTVEEDCCISVFARTLTDRFLHQPIHQSISHKFAILFQKL